MNFVSNEGTYVDVPRWVSSDDTSFGCRAYELKPGVGNQKFPVDTKTFDLDSLVTAINEYAEFVTSNLAFSGSVFLTEQYASRAVVDTDHSKTVIPWRDNVVLLAPLLTYQAWNMSHTPPTPNITLDDMAWKKGAEIREILIEGAKKNGGHYSYVNYASGGESEAEWYGNENLVRLRELKALWDPQNRFRFYGPISAGE